MADMDICASIGVEGRLGSDFTLGTGSSVTWELRSPRELSFSVVGGGKVAHDLDVDEIVNQLEQDPTTRRFASGAINFGYSVRISLAHFSLLSARPCLIFIVSGGDGMFSIGEKAVFVQGVTDHFTTYTSINYGLPDILPAMPFGVKTSGNLSAALKTTWQI